MAFIKTNLIPLICGAATLIMLVVTLLGVSGNKDFVQHDLAAEAAIVGQLINAARSPANDSTIAAAKRHADQFNEQCTQAMQVAQVLNKRDPLMPGIFPKAGNTAALEFANNYKQAFIKLRTEVLRGGGAPTSDDVAREQINIQEQRKAEQAAQGAADQDVFGGSSQTPNTPSVPISPRLGPGRPGGSGPPGGFGPGGGFPGGGSSGPPGGVPRPGSGPPGGGIFPGGGITPGGGFNPGGVPGGPDPNANDPKYNAELRATVRRAKSIRMYVDDDAFHVTNIVRTDTAPADADLWYAQMTLWIQQDVAKALAEVNEKAAPAVTGTASVLQLPVKRLESIRVAGYRLKDQAVIFPAPIGNAGGGANQVTRGFTGRVSGDDFDVVVFHVTVWLDQRVLPQVIDAITRQNLYQCYDLDIDMANASNVPQRMLFGDAPVVQAHMQFEGYFSRNVYKPLMPEAIVTLLIGGGDASSPAGGVGAAPAAPAAGPKPPAPKPPAKPADRHGLGIDS